MRRLSYFLSLAFLLAVPVVGFAQSGETIPAVPEIRAVINGQTEVEVGKTIVLDASVSQADSDTVTYTWLRNGSRVSTGEEMLLTVDEPGKYDITLRVQDRLNGERRESEITYTVRAYIRKIVLVAGPGISAEKLEQHRQSGDEFNVFVDVLQAKDIAIPLGLEDVLTKLIGDNVDRFIGSQAVILWANDGASAMNALSRALQQFPEKRALMTFPSVVLITDGSIPALSRVVRGPFSALKPIQIFITRKEAIHPLIEAENADQFLQLIEKRDYDFIIVDDVTTAIRPWNLLSNLVNFMVTKGVNSRMIVLLLMLPVILTIITFLKQVIGVTTFGLYTPAVIALSLVALGWQIGLVFLIIIIAAGYLTRALMRNMRLLYIPKIAVILTVISIVLLLVLALAAQFKVLLAPESIFILLIMTTLSEEFMSLKAEEGLRSAVMAVSETVLVALICFSLVQWEVLKSLILAYPELVFLTLIANYFLGRWTGLRVSEMIRFKEIFKHMEE